MPNRLIREGFLDSATIEKLSPGAECCYHRMLISADDAGRLDARLDVLKARIYPIKAKITLQILEKQIDECVESELAIRYQCAGDQYLQLTKWQSTGQSKISRFPWSDGRFEIEVVPIGTRAGMKNFICTSILNRINGSKMASASHPDGIPMASVPHADGIPMPSTLPQVDKKSQKPMASVPHADGIPMASVTHQSKISSAPSETETETETETHTQGGSSGVDASGVSAFPPSLEVAWPSLPEWLAFCDRIVYPPGPAEIEWHNAERKCPPWKGVGRWQSHAAYCKSLWEQRGRPMGSAATGIPMTKPAAPRKRFESEIRARIAELKQRIATHPVNPNSSKHNPNPTPAQVDELKNLRRKLAVNEAELEQYGG